MEAKTTTNIVKYVMAIAAGAFAAIHIAAIEGTLVEIKKVVCK